MRLVQNMLCRLASQTSHLALSKGQKNNNRSKPRAQQLRMTSRVAGVRPLILSFLLFGLVAGRREGLLFQSALPGEGNS